MAAEKHFDTVYVFETDFQKTVVESLLKTRPQTETRLIVDARSGKISLGGEEYQINLNGIKPVLRSLRSRQTLPAISAGELVCTAFTGFNCRLFLTSIEYEKLSIYDDGTGTPVILKDGRYVTRSVHNVVRYLFASIYTLLRYGKALPSDKRILGRLDTYYSIYPFVDERYTKEHAPQLRIVALDYFHTRRYMLRDAVGYISTGESGMKNSALARAVAAQGRKPEYYPHPHEDVSAVDKALISGIIRPQGTIESYFEEKGVPGRLYGEISTAFLNLKLMGCPSKMTVFYKYDKARQSYFDLFETVGIELEEIR